MNAAGGTTSILGPITLHLPPSGRFTVVVAGSAVGAGQSKGTTLTTQILQENTAAPATGRARLRVINLSPDATGLDIVAGDQRLVSNLTSSNASAFLELPAGTYPIQITAMGTTTSLFGPLNSDLVAGRTYTLVITGARADNTLKANLLVDQSFDAQARFANAVSDAPGLDIFADGRLVANNLTFPNATSYLSLPSGGACIAINPAGRATPATAPARLDLQGGVRQTVVVSGLTASTQSQEPWAGASSGSFRAIASASPSSSIPPPVRPTRRSGSR